MKMLIPDGPLSRMTFKRRHRVFTVINPEPWWHLEPNLSVVDLESERVGWRASAAALCGTEQDSPCRLGR